VNSRLHSRRAAPLLHRRHRDENPITVTPLVLCAFARCLREESALTRNAGCHTQFPALPSFSRRSLAVTNPLSSLSFHTVTHCKFYKSFALTFIQLPGGCTPSLCPPEFRILFQVPYTPSPLFATLTKSAGVYAHSSHLGTSPIAMKSRGVAPLFDWRHCFTPLPTVSSAA